MHNIGSFKKVASATEPSFKKFGHCGFKLGNLGCSREQAFGKPTPIFARKEFKISEQVVCASVGSRYHQIASAKAANSAVSHRTAMPGGLAQSRQGGPDPPGRGSFLNLPLSQRRTHCITFPAKEFALAAKCLLTFAFSRVRTRPWHRSHNREIMIFGLGITTCKRATIPN